jgi:hypothetical protein
MPTKLQTRKKTANRSKRTTTKNASKSQERNWRKEDRENLDTLEFIQAIDRYRRRTQKAFPTWSEVLDILKSLGYRKIQK